MKLALISDIHANLEALEAVLKKIDTQETDRLYCLGDIVGYGCDPVACIEVVRKHCDEILIGNHDFVALNLEPGMRMNSHARQAMEFTTSCLGDKELSWLADLDLECQIEDLHLVHASPFEPDQWHYIINEDDARLGMSQLKKRIGFIGHTHLPMVFSEKVDGSCRVKVGHDCIPGEESRHIINVGSVGQPRDKDPRACYVTYDTTTCELNYHRVEYDIKLTQQKMIQANVPKMLIERIEVGR
jgi:diadenosine tetraphosphatase ApaH/serine/threonine PP2A family protein phosphatase